MDDRLCDLLLTLSGAVLNQRVDRCKVNPTGLHHKAVCPTDASCWWAVELERCRWNSRKTPTRCR